MGFPLSDAGFFQGLNLILPPYSATFLLIEGKTRLQPPGHETGFRVYGSTSEGIWPLEGAMVRLAGSVYLSDQNGIINMKLPEGIYPYRIDAEGFPADSGILEIPVSGYHSDTLEWVNTQPEGPTSGAYTSSGSLVLFPNPASRRVMVSHTAPIIKAEILDWSGKYELICLPHVSSMQCSMNIEGLPDGLYMVRIEDERGHRMWNKLLILR